MTTIKGNQHGDFYMDDTLHENLMAMKRAIANDWDAVFLVDGIEGSGKSVIAGQCAYVEDETFDLTRYEFAPTEFMEQIVGSKKYMSHVYDESRRGLNARRTMSSINNTLVNMLAEIRQKNLFTFIVIPTLFDMDKNIACWRARGLIHVYTHGNLERGRFAFYGRKKLKQLYMKGKRFYEYTEKPDFTGTFPNHYVVDKSEYKDKKLQALKKYGKSEMDKIVRQEMQKILYKEMRAKIPELLGKDLNNIQWAQLFGVERHTIGRWENEEAL